MEGYKYMFDQQLVTVWSAPNYCYRSGNIASILSIHDDGALSFEVYDDAPENDRYNGPRSDTRRPVSCPSSLSSALTLAQGGSAMP